MITQAPERSSAEDGVRPSTRRWDWRGGVSLAARLGLGGVLLVAGGLKAFDPVQSALAVQAYQLLPSDVATVVGYTLPWAEIAMGLLLVVGLFTRPTAIAAGLLMVVFIAGVASAWARGLAIDCGCFGGGGEIAAEETAYGTEIVRDAVYLAAAAWLAIWPRSWFSLDAWRGAHAHPAAVDTVA